MSANGDGQIEYWVGLIQELVYESKDTRSNQVKLDDAVDLQTQIHERIDTINLDESYVLDVVTRVNNLIEILKERLN